MIVRGGCLLNYDCFANAEVCVLDVVRIRTKQFDHKAGHWLYENTEATHRSPLLSRSVKSRFDSYFFRSNSRFTLLGWRSRIRWKTMSAPSHTINTVQPIGGGGERRTVIWQLQATCQSATFA